MLGPTRQRPGPRGLRRLNICILAIQHKWSLLDVEQWAVFQLQEIWFHTPQDADNIFKWRHARDDFVGKFAKTF
jgi:hypothetical protein